MKLQVASDLHLEFRHTRGKPLAPQVQDALVPQTDADIIVLAGDIAPGESAVTFAGQVAHRHDKPVILVPGNHEYYGGDYRERLDAMLAVAADYPGVTLLAPGQLVLDGVRFLGATLWSDFALFSAPAEAMEDAQWVLADFVAIRLGGRLMTPADQVTLHARELDYLQQALAQPFAGPTVVVTHHAPAWGSVAERFRQDRLTPAFVSNLEHHVAASGAALWIHGHTHDQFDYRVGTTRVICNAAGYPHEGSGEAWLPSFRPGWVVDLD